MALSPNIYLHPCTRLGRLTTQKELVYYLTNVVSHSISLARLIREHAIDIVVSSNLLPGLVAGRLAKAFNIPLVFELVDYYPAFVKRSEIGPLTAIAESSALTFLRSNLNCAELVITSSTTLADLVKSLAESKEVRVIPNGVDTEAFTSRVPVRKDQKRRNRLNVCMLGSFEFWIDFDYMKSFMEEILQKVPDSVLYLAGKQFNKSKEITSEIQSLVSSFKPGQIVMPGFIPYPEVPRFLSQMDVCLLPFKNLSISDHACPIKLFEYLSMGKLVVSSHMIETQRIAKDVVVMGEPKLAARKVVEVIESGELNLISNRAVEFAKNFDWKQIADKYYDALSSVVNRRGSA